MKNLPLLLALALSAACIIPAQQQTGAQQPQPGYGAPSGGGDPNGGGYAGGQGGGESGAAPAAGDPNATGGGDGASAAPTTVSVEMHSDCGETVHIFLGKDPKYGSGTASTMGSNNTTSQSFQVGDMVWLTDDNQNGIASATVSASTHEIRIDCGSISAQ